MCVDGILGIGDCKTVERVIRNSRRLEEDKKFRFSRNKNQMIYQIKGGFYDEIQKSKVFF